MGARRRWMAAGLVIAALAAVIAYVCLYSYVCPTAALRMTVFRGAAARRAGEFLASERVTIPRGYHRVITFETDGRTQAYLEQTLGLAKANQVAQSEGLIYTWSVRWFRPGEQEEFWANVTPDGRVLGYWDLLPDDAPARESRRPQEVARAFVTRVAGLDLSDYHLHDTSREPQSKRVDYSYTWERTDPRLAEARARVWVQVTGDRVIGYRRYVHVPEAFAHRFSKEQEKGNLLADVAMTLIGGLLLAALIGIVMALRRRDLRLREARLPATLLAAAVLLVQVNALPLAYAGFDVHESFGGFVAMQALEIITSTGGAYVGALLLVAAAEWFFRRSFRGRPPLLAWFSRQGIASAPGRRRLLLGYGLGLLQLGYVAVFYFLAQRFLRAWSPSQVRHDDLFSTAVPWAYPLLVAVEAAVTEEFTMRVIAISLLRRVLKRDWLAVLIPALIWGFAHASYPNKPFYIRGIEVSVWGVVFGYVFLRFGVLPSLVSHATYNAVVVGSSFLSSITLFPKLNFGVVLIICLVPLAAAWWWARRGLGGEAPAVEEFVPPAVPEAAGVVLEVEPPRRPLPRRAWVIGLAALAVGSGPIGVVENAEQGGGRYHWAEMEEGRRYLSRVEAVRAARQVLRREGGNVRGWAQSVTVSSRELDSDTQRYLEHFLTRVDAEQVAARTLPPAMVWVVQWQRPLAREYWAVTLYPDGRLWGVVHHLPEEASGPRLSRNAAHMMAAATMESRGFDLRHYRLTGENQRDYPHRTAYLFIWEPRDLRVGGAQFDTIVRADGTDAEEVHRGIRIPDSEVFVRERETPAKITGYVLMSLLALLLFGWGAVVYIRALTRFGLDWRWGARAVAAMAVAALAQLVLLAPALWSGLSADTSPAVYLAQALAQMAGTVALIITVMAILLPIGVPLWRAGLPGVPGPRFWWGALWRPWRQREAWREALLAQLPAAGVVAVLGACWEAIDWLTSSAGHGALIPQWFVKLTPPAAPDAFVPVGSLWPAGSAVAISVLAAMGMTLGWLLLVAMAKAMFRTPRTALIVYALGAVASVLSSATDWHQAVQYGWGAALGAVGLWALYRLVLRDNPLTLAALGLTLGPIGMGSDLLAFPAHRVGAIVLMVAAAMPFVWAVVTTLVQWRRRPPPTPLPETEVEAVAGDGGAMAMEEGGGS